MRWWWSATDLTPLIQGIVSRLSGLARDLTTLTEEIRHMASTQQELDAALTAFEQAVTAQIAEIQAGVQAILTKVGNQPDLAPEIARIQAAQQALQTEADAVKTAAGP